MRTTFFSILYVLLAEACWTQTMQISGDKDVFKSAFKQLEQIISSVKKEKTLLHSPTKEIQDCCAQSALQCFNSQLLKIQTDVKVLQIKLHKNLQKKVIVSSVGVCPEENVLKARCQSCNSHPMVKSEQFLNDLKFLLQKSFSKSS